MNDQIAKSCNLLLNSREKIKTVFRWEGGLIHLACAGIYVLKEKEVDVSVLKDCKELIDQKVGIFSNFRSTAGTTIASMIAVSENPERTLNNGLTVYQLLKKELNSTISLIIAQEAAMCAAITASAAASSNANASS